MTGGIYRIKCLVSKNIYIGSAKDFDNRRKSHFDDLMGNCHRNPHLQRAYNKYGAQNFEFEIVEILGEYDKKLYFTRENFYIDQIVAAGTNYNIAKAEGGWTYHTESRKEEIRAKVSNSLKAYSATLTKEERSKKFGVGKFGVLRTAREKQLISAKLKGVPKSEETKRRMSVAQTGLLVHIESGRRVGLSNKGKPANNRRKVIIEDQIFDSLKEAATFLGICSGAVCNRIKRGKSNIKYLTEKIKMRKL